MVSIVNGARIMPPKPNIDIPSPDPNTKLTVINNAGMITEEKKSEAPANKKIASFRPKNLKEFSDAKKREHIRGKQRRGDISEVLSIVKKKIDAVKKQAIKGTRFAEEVGKGSIFDILT